LVQHTTIWLSVFREIAALPTGYCGLMALPETWFKLLKPDPRTCTLRTQRVADDRFPGAHDVEAERVMQVALASIKERGAATNSFTR
jgi:hypothetical protein